MSGYDGLEQERVFPRILHVEADYRKFYEADRMGIRSVVQDRRDLQVLIASHGMIHVDHRLMSKRAQELSILTSCSILGTTTLSRRFTSGIKRQQESVISIKLF
jgi:hypothetical protein